MWNNLVSRICLGDEIMSKQDILNRQEYIDKLIKIIDCSSPKKAGTCFAIDGQWGVGKTYILEMLEEQLEVIQLEETNDNKYFVFNYNCWEYDYYEEPSIAIIAAMIDKLDKKEAFFIENVNVDEVIRSSWNIAKEKILEIAGEFSKNKIGVNLVELVKNVKEDKEEREKEKYEFDEMFAFRKTLTGARDRLTELAKTKSIVFIVDELDRCLPDYAIKVMERLHHLFDGIDNITVLLSVDSKQLDHSIQKIYGNEENIDGYLKKFIDFTLTLDNGAVNDDFKEKYKDYFDYFNYIHTLDVDDLIFFDSLFIVLFDDKINIRIQEKLMAKAKLIHELAGVNEKLDLALLCFEMIWIVLSYKYQNFDLHKVMGITKSPNNFAVDRKIAELFRETELTVKQRYYNGGKIIEPTLEERVMILILYEDGMINDDTYLISEIEKAEEFVELAEIMKK